MGITHDLPTQKSSYGPDFDDHADFIVRYIRDVLKSGKGFYAHADGWYFTDGQTCQVCGEPKRTKSSE